MYSGMCIGGPLAGTNLTSERPVYLVRTVPDLVFHETGENTTELAANVCEYKHTLLMMTPKGEAVTAWLHENVSDVRAAMEVLFGAYSTHHKRLKGR